MKKLQQNGFGVLETLLIVIAVVLVGFVGYYVHRVKTDADKNLQTTSSQAQPSFKKSDKPVKSVATDNVVATGVIKGEASYPSSGLPDDEEICAQDVNNKAKAPICVNVGKADTNKYSLTVPVGTYNVYAQTAQFGSDGYKAYYNEYSKCGNSVNCPEVGHKQYIDVVVEANATVTGVDPGDWYATE